VSRFGTPQAASFLSDLPLMHVTSARWDEFKKLATVRYRELMGDHPVVPTRTITYDEPGIEEDSMYIMDGQRRLCLLRPFLAGSTCPECRNWSTFHIDRSADGKIEYKSLEHGHPKEDALLDEALPYVGLLLLQMRLGSGTSWAVLAMVLPGSGSCRRRAPMSRPEALTATRPSRAHRDPNCRPVTGSAHPHRRNADPSPVMAQSWPHPPLAQSEPAEPPPECAARMRTSRSGIVTGFSAPTGSA
jgi:hypothetical protein